MGSNFESLINKLLERDEQLFNRLYGSADDPELEFCLAINISYLHVKQLNSDGLKSWLEHKLKTPTEQFDAKTADAEQMANKCNEWANDVYQLTYSIKHDFVTSGEQRRLGEKLGRIMDSRIEK